MGKLTVIREQTFLDFGKNFQIILDGKEIGELGNNEAKTFDITEGGHVIQIGDSKSSIDVMSKEMKIIINNQI